PAPCSLPSFPPRRSSDPSGTFQPATCRGEGPASGRVPNAERQAVGLETSAPAYDFDGDPSTKPTTANPDHLTENGIREELGLPDRPRYALEFRTTRAR